jgi:TetR/AcrR family transcriptional regulator
LEKGRRSAILSGMRSVDNRPSVQTPKQKRAQQTRDRLLRTAARVFADKGFDGARVSELARRAGASVERIYAYFGSKRGLYREVLIAVYSEVAADNGLLGLTESDIPFLTRKVIDRFFALHEQNPRFWRLLCWENLNGGRSLAAEDWVRIRHSYLSHLESLYREGQKQGVFRRDIDFTTYILLLFSTTYFYFSNRMTMSRLLELDLERDAVRHRIEEEVLAIMDHGLSPGCGT